MLKAIESHLDEERHNWALWFAFAVVCGASLYFSLSYEPSYPFFSFIFLGCALLLALYGFSRSFMEVSALFSSLMLLGLFLGVLFSMIRVHEYPATPMLREALLGVSVTGRVSSLAPAGGAVRLMMQDVHDAQGNPLPPLRMVVRGAAIEDYPLGSHIRAYGRFYPPREKIWSGGFDGVRHAWFAGIGGYGYSLGAPQLLTKGEEKDFMTFLRLKIDKTIAQSLTGNERLVASALLTGYRSGLGEELWEAMRGSGLAHLLAISGLHMALVSGTIFMFLRLMFALIPSLVLNHNVKKIAAFCAIIAGFFYLLLTGGTTPTMRAFIMVTLFFIAVMMSRRIYGLAAVAWAAVALVLLEPSRILSSGFQMSFMAVIALAAFFHFWQKRKPFEEESHHIRWHQKGVMRYIIAVALSSLIAGAVTMPFVAYHFHLLPLYGLAANLVAVPLTAFWIMPAGLLALVLMPIGLAHVPLIVMGEGIGWLMTVAREVHGWKYSVMAVQSFGIETLFLWTFAVLWLCFWKQRRSWGVVLMMVSVVMMIFADAPRLLAAKNGDHALLLKDESILIAMSPIGEDSVFAEWQKSLGAPQLVRLDEFLAEKTNFLTCDNNACLWHQDNISLAFVHEERVLHEECRTAHAVFNDTLLEIKCLVPFMNRNSLALFGAQEFWQTKDGFKLRFSYEGVRPWVSARGDIPPPQE